MQTDLAVNLQANEMREEQLEGRKAYVVPFVGAVAPSVMNGQLILPEELQASSFNLNGRPLVIYHPTEKINGKVVFISANDANVAVVGRVLNAVFANGRLTGEAWFVDELLEAGGREGRQIKKDVIAGNVIENSLGWFQDTEYTTGELDGQPYAQVARNLVHDHLAILPDEIGACSVNDGCGINRNSQEGGDMEPDNKDTKPNQQLDGVFAEFKGVLDQILSYVDGSKSMNVNAELGAWISETYGLDAEALTEEQVEKFTAVYEGSIGGKEPAGEPEPVNNDDGNEPDGGDDDGLIGGMVEQIEAILDERMGALSQRFDAIDQRIGAIEVNQAAPAEARKAELVKSIMAHSRLSEETLKGLPLADLEVMSGEYETSVYVGRGLGFSANTGDEPIKPVEPPKMLLRKVSKD